MLPVLTLLGVTLAASIRMVRAGMVEVAGVGLRRRWPRLNGVPRAARGRAATPCATRSRRACRSFALTLQYLIGGIIVDRVPLRLSRASARGSSTRSRSATCPMVQSVAADHRGALHPLNIVADLLVVLLVPRAADGAVTRRVTGRRAALARRTRHAGGGRARACLRRAVLLVALLGPFVRAVRPRRARSGIPLERAARRRPARHRLPRPRRAQPRALGRAQRDRCWPSRRRSSPTSSASPSGSSPATRALAASTRC